LTCVAAQAYVVERSNELIRLNEKKAQAKKKGHLLSKARLLTPEQRKIEQEREEMLQELHRERERSERLESEKRAKEIKQVEPNLQRLLRMMDTGERERDRVHRRLLQRKGMHRIVLRLLGCLPADFTETAGPLCYRSLALLCDDAPGVQVELSRHVQVFAHHFDSIPHEVATVLSAIYKDNVDLCYKVQEHIISKIVSLMRDDLAAPYLWLARIIIAPKDQIVRRNQNLVTKHLDSYDVQLLLHKSYAQPSAKARTHFNGATNGTSNGDGAVKVNGHAAGESHAIVQRAKPAKAQANHLASIDLLTACMTEYNHDNKRRCRGGNPNLTLTLANLEADLYDRTVPVSVKVSLVAFLRQAYILVDMTNMALLMQPEMVSIFEQLARWIELLPVDAHGSKLKRLSKQERVLLTDSYMAAAKDYFGNLPASDLRQRDSARVRVAGHLLEVLVDLVLSSREDMGGDEELRIIHVIMLLANSVQDSFERYKHLVSGDNKLRNVLLASDLTPDDDDDDEKEESSVGDGKCERGLLLEKARARVEAQRGQEKLSVPEGVVVFGDDFLEVMSGPGSAINEFEALCAAFMQAQVLLACRARALRRASPPLPRTSSARRFSSACEPSVPIHVRSPLACACFHADDKWQPITGT